MKIGVTMSMYAVFQKAATMTVKKKSRIFQTVYIKNYQTVNFGPNSASTKDFFTLKKSTM